MKAFAALVTAVFLIVILGLAGCTISLNDQVNKLRDELDQMKKNDEIIVQAINAVNNHMEGLLKRVVVENKLKEPK